jgi:hypothetical protein
MSTLVSKSVSVSSSATDTFTDYISVPSGADTARVIKFYCTVTGGTFPVTLQGRIVGTTDVWEQTLASTPGTYEFEDRRSDVEYRLGVKSGASGTAVACRLEVLAV